MPPTYVKSEGKADGGAACSYYRSGASFPRKVIRATRTLNLSDCGQTYPKPIQCGNRSWRAARDPPTLSLPFMRTMRFFVFEIPMSQPFASTRFFMAFAPRLVRRGKDELRWLTWTKAQRVAKGLFWPLALWRQSRSFSWLLSESLAKTWDRTHRKRRSSRHTCDKENQQCRMT